MRCSDSRHDAALYNSFNEFFMVLKSFRSFCLVWREFGADVCGTVQLVVPAVLGFYKHPQPRPALGCDENIMVRGEQGRRRERGEEKDRKRGRER